MVGSSLRNFHKAVPMRVEAMSEKVPATNSGMGPPLAAVNEEVI
jgi:hypothetical protein